METDYQEVRVAALELAISYSKEHMFEINSDDIIEIAAKFEKFILFSV